MVVLGGRSSRGLSEEWLPLPVEISAGACSPCPWLVVPEMGSVVVSGRRARVAAECVREGLSGWALVGLFPWAVGRSVCHRGASCRGAQVLVSVIAA